MREIKFKCWNKKENKMESLIDVDFKKEVVLVEDEEAYVGKLLMLSDTNLLQYTGLKDKDGNEIYEGDILRITKLNNYYKNKYEELTHIVKFKNMRFSISDLVEILDIITIEIIGNIYENKEFLGDKI